MTLLQDGSFRFFMKDTPFRLLYPIKSYYLKNRCGELRKATCNRKTKSTQENKEQENLEKTKKAKKHKELTNNPSLT